MLCLVCETKILERDSFFWRLDQEQASDGAIHDDCLIREAEFDGEPDRAKEIFVGSLEAYKIINSLPKE